LSIKLTPTMTAELAWAAMCLTFRPGIHSGAQKPYNEQGH